MRHRSIICHKNQKIWLGIIALFAVGMLVLCCLSLIQPVKGEPVNVLSSGFLKTSGAYYVFGELENSGSTPVYQRVNLISYDVNNNFINSTYVVCCWEPILPNEKVPFWTIITDTEGGSKVDHYSFEITTEQVYNVTTPQLNIVSLTNETTQSGIRVSGEIENVGPTYVNYSYAFVTYYDSNGKMIFADHTYPEPEILAPGQRGSFTTAFIYKLYNISDVASYTVVPGGIRDHSFGQPPVDQPPITGTGNGTLPPFSDTVWAPPTPNAVVAPTVAVAAVGAVGAVAAVGASNPTSWAGKVCDKCKDMVPEGAKKWFEEFIASKSKRNTDRKGGSTFAPTRGEFVAYTVSLVALTIGFSYAEVSSLNEILFVLPTILATAVLIEVVKTYTLEVVARRNGVWAEHKIWFFGLVMFIVTSFGFGLPFSSPSKNEYYCEHTTKRLTAVIASTSILIALAFAAIFFGLLSAGFYLIGSTGLGMCIILGFVDSLPIAPMSGKALFKYKKAAWAGIFLLTLAIYVSWILFL